MYRISLGLPAIAIGNEPIGLKQSFDITAGNNLRMLGLLTIIHIILGADLLAYLFAINFLQLLNPSLGLVSVFVLGIPVLFFNMMLLASLMTSLYGFFVERRDF